MLLSPVQVRSRSHVHTDIHNIHPQSAKCVLVSAVDGEHLKEVVSLELLVGPLEEQFDGLLQVRTSGSGIRGHRVCSTPVQPPCRGLVSAHMQSINQCDLQSGMESQM